MRFVTLPAVALVGFAIGCTLCAETWAVGIARAVIILSGFAWVAWRHVRDTRALQTQLRDSESVKRVLADRLNEAVAQVAECDDREIKNSHAVAQVIAVLISKVRVLGGSSAVADVERDVHALSYHVN